MDERHRMAEARSRIPLHLPKSKSPLAAGFLISNMRYVRIFLERRCPSRAKP